MAEHCWPSRCLRELLSLRQMNRGWLKELNNVLSTVGSLELVRMLKIGDSSDNIRACMGSVLEIIAEQDLHRCWTRVDNSSYCPFYKEIKLSIGREGCLSGRVGRIWQNWMRLRCVVSPTGWRSYLTECIVINNRSMCYDWTSRGSRSIGPLDKFAQTNKQDTKMCTNHIFDTCCFIKMNNSDLPRVLLANISCSSFIYKSYHSHYKKLSFKSTTVPLNVFKFKSTDIGNAWTKCRHCANDDQTKCCKGESTTEACDDEGHCHNKLTTE
uniref:Uncharacterized protein n=1 Tax=Strigamia maritima TaxID=126957 RepID=T1IJZ6_STRMM